jgi:DEAD/DEAH box helicase domain-containing protein
MSAKFEVIFDIETKKLFNEITTTDPADLGVSLVCLYHREVDSQGHEVRGEMLSFWEPDLEKMWKYFLEADRIIGYNSLRFDVPALRLHAPSRFSKLPHFDLLDIIYAKTGHRASLNSFLKHTLGKQKTDVGTDAVDYWNKGDAESLAKLKHYCEMDVALTGELYDYGQKNKQLKYMDHWNTVRTVEVDFSYPVDFSSHAQTGLF